MSKNANELTEAEWAIIKTVWTLEPCAAPSVQEALVDSQQWTYSTVRTLMDRMVAKGLLKAEKVRHITLYRAVITREQAQRGELMYALKHAFDGALTPMVQCLLDAKNLSSKDIEDIEAMIKARKSKK
jgi:BlaI family penicillinase repressor